MPDRKTGHTTDDNARALDLVLRAAAQGVEGALDLAGTYLAYAQGEEGWFHNFYSYARTPLPETPSEDTQGRALRALARAYRHWREDRLGWAAGRLLERGLGTGQGLRHPRGLAHLALAAADLLLSPWAQEAEALLRQSLKALLAAYRRASRPGWAWFEKALTYENALLPQALLRGARVLEDREVGRIGLESLYFLDEIHFKEEVFASVGNRGWYPKGGRKASFDQQPLEAWAAVEAYLEAYRYTGEAFFRERAREAGAWFLGRNLLGLPLLDERTWGCSDGLTPEGLNPNQGAESLLAWLGTSLALWEVEDAGKGQDRG